MREFRRLRARRMGHYVLIDVEVGVNPRATAGAAHQTALHVRQALLETIPEAADVLVHTYAYGAELKPPGPQTSSPAASGTETVLHRPQCAIEDDARLAVWSVRGVDSISDMRVYFEDRKSVV